MDTNYTNTQQFDQEESIDIKALFFKFFRFWYFFALTIFVALVIAFLFNKYTKPVFEVKTTVLLKDDKANQNLIGLGLMNNKQNLENEMGIINSYSLAKRTINNLDFEISYFEEDNFVTHELYKSSPIKVEMDWEHPQPKNIKFNLFVLSNVKYRLTVQTEKAILYNFAEKENVGEIEEAIIINEEHNFGEVVENNLFKFTIFLTEEFNSDFIDKNLSFVFSDYKGLISTFRSTQLEPINREASIIEISIKGDNKQKLTDYLNELTRQYLLRGIEKKNKIADNTIRFIDSELVDITDSLTFAETRLQNFRINNEVMDLDFKANQVFENMQKFEEEKAQFIIKAKYYRNLQDYLSRNKDNIDDVIIPSSMGIEDPLLSQLISGLAELYAERADILFSSSEKNPMVAAIDQRIRTTKTTILENLSSIINTSEISIESIDERIFKLEKEVSRLPETQRQLFGIERKFKLNDALYTFLLQKRSEAQIVKASNLPDNEIIEGSFKFRVTAKERFLPAWKSALAEKVEAFIECLGVNFTNP